MIFAKGIPTELESSNDALSLSSVFNRAEIHARRKTTITPSIIFTKKERKEEKEQRREKERGGKRDNFPGRVDTCTKMSGCVSDRFHRYRTNSRTRDDAVAIGAIRPIFRRAN